MKVGDLVKCLWQPTTSKIENGYALPMEHTIKGELGIIIKQCDGHCFEVSFPQLGYAHTLNRNTFEVINESR